MKRAILVLSVLLMLPVAATSGAEDELVFDFANGPDPNLVKTEGFTWRIVRREDSAALRLDRQPGSEWAHFYLQPEQGNWDFSAYEYLVLEVTNLSGGQVACAWEIENENRAEEKGWRRRFARLAGGESKRLIIDLAPAISEKNEAIQLIGMRSLPLRKPSGTAVVFEPAQVARLHFYTYASRWPRSFLLTTLRGGRGLRWEPPKDKPLLPFVDRFGQYSHRDWPGKTHSTGELKKRAEKEATALSAHGRPANWNQYGGWAAGPQLESTGRFRVVKHQGKWSLVDPEGRLFFSHGVGAVRIDGEFTPIEKRRHYFSELPGEDDPDFGWFYRRFETGQQCFGSEPVLCYSFSDANLQRKYGAEWAERFVQLAHERLANWGFNTLGNWSDPEVTEERRTSYMRAGRTPGCRYLSGKADGKNFIDVFSPRFDEALEKLTRQVADTGEDPWCIGYFVHNELPWDKRIISRATLASRPDQPAKVEFVRMMRETFGEIEELNHKWHTRYSTWEALLENRQPPDTKRAAAEMDAFERRVAERYFTKVRAAVKKGSADTLYLGCRFNTFNEGPAEIAAQYCDIVSYNLYRTPDRAAAFVFPGKADVPLLIGEWHFGALDRGQCDPGMRQVADQKERAEHYTAYMEGVLAHPQFVGAHWFRYKDQSFTGRHSDGANAQNGLLDICDTPYTETIAASRAVGKRLYELRWSDAADPASPGE